MTRCLREWPMRDVIIAGLAVWGVSFIIAAFLVLTAPVDVNGMYGD